MKIYKNEFIKYLVKKDIICYIKFEKSHKERKGVRGMLDLILIIMLIVSISKPDILLSKKMKERANDEQKIILSKNLRKIYAIMVALFESMAIMRYTEIVGIILTIVFIILFFVISLPAIKENSKITKELN